MKRRELLKWTGISLGGALALKVSFPFVSHRFEGLFHRIGISEFTEVSASLLGISASQLNPEVAKTYWEKISLLPGAQDQINILHESIKKIGTPIESENQLPESARPFAKTLIEVWYTGVIELPKDERRRLFYDQSLMFELFKKERPAPNNCWGEVGSWTKSPYA